MATRIPHKHDGASGGKSIHISDAVTQPLDKTPLFTEYERQQLEAYNVERLRRRTEATQLYEPLPLQEAFHRSTAPERILRGSNRAGKTLPAAVEIAWAMTNRHPYRDYPSEGRVFAVGESERHIATVMWHKLSRQQVKMRIIRDLETGIWRAYRPWVEGDRNSETRPMPPLIPHRMIASITWYSKAYDCPRMVKLKSGWEIHFFSGAGKPPQGSDIAICWLDEEIPVEEWYLEMSARLLDQSGNFIWSATPQTGGDQLWNLHLRAEEEKGSENPQVTEFPMLLMDNPYIDKRQKKLLADKYAHDPDAYRVRIQGEYLITSFRVYPTYSLTRHGCDKFDIPDNWCRYVAIDPGHRVCAALFAAVPPPEMEQQHIYIYDELYIRDCDASMFAEKMKHKCAGQNIQAFIIDRHGSIGTEAGTGETIWQQYMEALHQQKVESRATGSGFIFADGKVKDGLMKVRKWLGGRVQEDKAPYLQMFRGFTSMLDHELERYHKRRQKGHIIDDPDQKDCHAADCLRYLAMYKCSYVVPGKMKSSPIREYLDKKHERFNRKNPRQALRLSAGKQPGT